ncbi:MAG: LysM peptidoglycan-binding domain-containing protein [Sulfurovum sp.]|nr:LysM peptidoglycan-binding domain-containing protein [Sulfurovum sp.]
MTNKYLIFIIFIIFLPEFVISKNYLDCSVVLAGTSECNPYESKFLKAKSIQYDTDKKELIISKTMPVPEKFEMKIFSVEDLIEKYIKIEDPLRFQFLSKEKIEKSPNLDLNKKTNVLLKEKGKKIVIRYGKYKVSKGDSFHSIAKKFFMVPKELLRINLMDKKSKIKIGAKLRIPLEQKIINAIVSSEYTISSGDSLHSIARKFNIKSSELAKINGIESYTLIKVGKKLKLTFDNKLKKKSNVKNVKSNKVSKKKKRAILNKKLKRKGMKVVHVFGKRVLRVTATAYTSHANQTDSTPFLAAWNNNLRPGMKIIAVSRDMLTKYGMKNGTKVRIAGLSGYYEVRDKMNKRYTKRIDIYMGMDRRRALRWGRKSAMIYW